MTTFQRLLVLDAALTTCECLNYNKELTAAIRLIQDTFEETIADDLENKYPVFGDYLDAQKAALQTLLKNPAVFGGDPDAQ